MHVPAGEPAMILTRLRIVGFKSFVEPTDFLIEPGLTGVVGPNGCGKSNLVEALRWVMGENSHKNMRATGMDDVIFSGSTTRPARNHAEVMLTIANDDHTAPAAFNDAEILEVSRKIAREEGSTYRINGREVRARDVQILFADAATGARSPALVRQGRPACSPARGGTAPQGGGGQSGPGRGRAARDRSADRFAEEAGAAGIPIQEPVGRNPPAGSAYLRDQLCRRP
jgi:energy-coupling factor transporter ATP-binding protein EcfA2